MSHAAIMPFGKYKGQSVFSIAEEDPQYLHWMIKNVELRSDLEDEIEQALHEADMVPNDWREMPNWT